jgi:hypothetical protein
VEAAKQLGMSGIVFRDEGDLKAELKKLEIEEIGR